MLRALRLYRLFERPIARRVDLLLRCLELSCPALVGPESLPMLVEIAALPWLTHPSALAPSDLRSLLCGLTGLQALPGRDPSLRTGLAGLAARVSCAQGQALASGPAPRAAWPGGCWSVGGAVWEIDQIISRHALLTEGRSMQHCVASYWSKVRSGGCSLWSVRRSGYRTLTVEVSSDCAVVQVKGRRNRRPSPEELAVVERWARENGLNMHSGSIVG